MLSPQSWEQKPTNPLLIQDKDVLQPSFDPLQVGEKVPLYFLYTDLYHGAIILQKRRSIDRQIKFRGPVYYPAIAREAHNTWPLRA